ncbi:MAG TPA: hypothetical protein VL691_13855 [Vicinamibacteria bacterium]|nr:hypothetical protein [Vicinamibacteria bacterium]
MHAPIALALALVAGSDPSPAAPTSPPAAPPAACAAPEHRAFDFWAGSWSVTAGGRQAGRNRIERVLSGCALQEHWSGARGNLGTSLNWWDPGDRRWHQLWLDDQGMVLRLAGGTKGGAMVMEGELPGKDGKPQRQRITWTPLGGADAGKVRQLWEQSDDDGRTWSVAFDGLYAPVI